MVAQSASKMLVTFALVDFGANSRLYPICCQLVPCGSKLAATDKCRLQFLEKILTLLLALPFFKRKFLRFHDANIGKEADVINQLKNDAVSCLLFSLLQTDVNGIFDRPLTYMIMMIMMRKNKD